MIIVHSYAELDAKLRKLRGANLLFRGQCRNHPQMTSSIQRKVAESADLEALLGHGLVWRQAAELLAHEQLPPSPADEPNQIPPSARTVLATAILQHYGFPSEFVDVTFRSDVAIWFALREYNEQLYLDGPKSMPRFVRKAWYTESKERFGYLYVFDRPRWSWNGATNGDFIDLTTLIRPGHSRIQRQMAASLICGRTRRGIGDLKPFVHTIYRFPNPLPGADEAFQEMLNLFPTPTRDPIYRSLLESRFLESTYLTTRPQLFGRWADPEDGVPRFDRTVLESFKVLRCVMRPFDIPEYHNTFAADEQAEFRDTVRVLHPMDYFHWAKTRLKAKSRADTSALKRVARARPVLVSTTIHHLRELAARLSLTKPVRPPAWARNVFFEFSPHNFVGSYSSERTPRGVWIQGDGRTYMINGLGAENREPWYGEFCEFQWKRNSYEATTDRDAAVMRDFLMLALSVITEVVSGRAQLVLHKRRSGGGEIRWNPAESVETPAFLTRNWISAEALRKEDMNVVYQP